MQYGRGFKKKFRGGIIEENEKELHHNGADIVVKDIGEIGLQGIEDWFAKGLEEETAKESEN